MEDLDQQYRTILENLEQKAQNDYDKTILTLSGGASGITIAFIKDIVGTSPIVNSNLISTAWIMWGISLSAVLLSFYTSTCAMRKKIEQIDNKEVNENKLGGLCDSATGILNVISGITFILGVIFAAKFAYINL